MIKIAAAAQSGDDFKELYRQLVDEIKIQISDNPIHLGIIFATNHFATDLKKHSEKIRSELGIETLIGCTAEGVVGPESEIEDKPALSFWMAHLPGTTIEPFHINQDQIEEARMPEIWQRAFHTHPGIESNLILLGDPYSLNITQVLEGLNKAMPGCPVIGGMASGAQSPGQNVLLMNDEWFNDGGVGVSISGSVLVDTVISQGCRPVGNPFLITKGERNVIEELGGKPALFALNDLYGELSDQERELMDQGIFIGRVIDEYKQDFERGDFLIRNVVGVDQDTYSIAVLDKVTPGTTIQFHVRDAQTANEDLQVLLGQYQNHAPAGALLFSCNGRGTRMFSEANHDLNTIKNNLKNNAIAGFFCAGELGPVGGQNFIHGLTASVAVFRESS